MAILSTTSLMYSFHLLLEVLMEGKESGPITYKKAVQKEMSIHLITCNQQPQKKESIGLRGKRVSTFRPGYTRRPGMQ